VRGRRLARATAPARARAVAPVEPGVLEPGAWAVRQAKLPVWPIAGMFALLPLWWGLGVFYFVWPLFGAVLLTLLTSRGNIRLPTGTVLWLIFLGIVTVSATRLDHVTNLLVFGLRLGHLITGLLVGIYVYNLIRDGVPWTRVANPLAIFWLSMVALGWLGVLLPTFSSPSPFELVLPHSVQSERYILDITHLDSTEFNKFSRNPIYRPAAPYPYTNNWGTAYSFLVPFVLAYLMSVRRGPMRIVLLVSLPLSLVPAFLTLNRGMFIGLGAGLLYLGLRALLRGDVRLIASIGAVGALAWVATLVIPVGDLIANRVENTDSTRDRADLYVQTILAVQQSPLLGYGAPRLADTVYIRPRPDSHHAFNATSGVRI